MTRQLAARYADRHRQIRIDALQRTAKLLLFCVGVGAITIAPTWLGWWDTVLPAAVGIAIIGLVLCSVMILLPLTFIAYVELEFDKEISGASHLGVRSGRRVYLESGFFDRRALEAGLRPLSEFEVPDPIHTGQAPQFHDPRTALPVIAYLSANAASSPSTRRALIRFETALRTASEHGARFYILAHTLAGFTNAEIAARRRGDQPYNQST